MKFQTCAQSPPERLADLTRGRLKTPRERLVESLRGRVTDHHRFLLKLHLAQVDALRSATEEEVFHPSVRAQVAKLQDAVLDALEEHHVVKWLLSALETLPPDAARLPVELHALARIFHFSTLVLGLDLL